MVVWCVNLSRRFFPFGLFPPCPCAQRGGRPTARGFQEAVPSGSPRPGGLGQAKPAVLLLQLPPCSWAAARGGSRLPGGSACWLGVIWCHLGRGRNMSPWMRCPAAHALGSLEGLLQPKPDLPAITLPYQFRGASPPPAPLWVRQEAATAGSVRLILLLWRGTSFPAQLPNKATIRLSFPRGDYFPQIT